MKRCMIGLFSRMISKVVSRYSRKGECGFRREGVSGGRGRAGGGSGCLPAYVGDFVEIPAENMIKESRMENVNYCDKQYIVYVSPGYFHRKIRVNTYYLPQGEKIRLCTHYDRGLCDTLEEYNGLPIEYIEEQAYGSWMDGAR